MLKAKEIGIWILASLFLGFILSIKITWPMLSFEITDVIMNIGFMFILLFFFIGGQKLFAYIMDVETTVKLIGFRKWWFHEFYSFKFKFPAWLVWPIFLLLISVSKIKWLSIIDFDVRTTMRHQKKWRSDVKENQIAKLALAGPYTMLLVAIVLSILNIDNFARVAMLLAFTSLIPIGQGFKLLVSSHFMWVFNFTLFLTVYILMHFLPILPVLIIGIILGGVAFVFAQVFVNKGVVGGIGVDNPGHGPSF